MNTQRHPASASSPPATGPSPAAIPPIDAQARTAPARFSGAVVSSSSASDVGISSAAPAACTSRAATSVSTFGASAQPTEARVNTANPVRKTGLWPERSAMRPAGTRSAAKTIA